MKQKKIPQKKDISISAKAFKTDLPKLGSSISNLTGDAVIHILKQCIDPELEMDVWTLGLIYEIKINAAKKEIVIRMTLTSPMCPFARELMDQIEAALYDLGFEIANLDLVFDPPWQPTEEVKAMLGIG